MELSLARDAQNNRKRFYRYIAQKRKAKESVPPLMDEKGELVMTDMEKAEGLSNVFSSVFPASQASQVFHFPEPIDRGWGIKVLPTVSEEQVVLVPVRTELSSS